MNPMKDLEVSWNSWGKPHVRGPVYRMIELPVGAVGKYGQPITKYTSDWARVDYELVSPKATMLNPRQSGHEIEGRVRIRGKSYSAFTDGGENPQGGKGMIIVRDRARKR